MKIFGIAGWSGSGKTTLILKLIQHFALHSLSVSVLKHAHHLFEPDIVGKDSHSFRTGGAHQVLVASDKITMLIEQHPPSNPDLKKLLSRLAPVDLVIIEGFKFAPMPMPKCEIYSKHLGKELLFPPRQKYSRIHQR